MKKGLTELVFILDRSGSMHGLESDTVGGFNSMLMKQQKVDGTAYVSTVLFNDMSEVLHDRVDLAQMQPMTEEDFQVGGRTALLDAVGDAIRHIGNVHKYAREEDKPEQTIFVIITDGLENASYRYTTNGVKQMIEDKKRICGWEFLFLGANMDAVETAGHLGIRENRSASYSCDSQGLEVMYERMDSSLLCLRREKTLSPDWKKPIEEDLCKRKGK